ncbi:hypothetical protein ALCH109712_12280 [Alkalicoccus chagannorensis]
MTVNEKPFPAMLRHLFSGSAEVNEDGIAANPSTPSHPNHVSHVMLFYPEKKTSFPLLFCLFSLIRQKSSVIGLRSACTPLTSNPSFKQTERFIEQQAEHTDKENPGKDEVEIEGISRVDNQIAEPGLRPDHFAGD